MTRDEKRRKHKELDREYIKEKLEGQLELLSEQSKKGYSLDAISEATYAMCEIARTLRDF